MFWMLFTSYIFWAYIFLYVTVIVCIIWYSRPQCQTDWNSSNLVILDRSSKTLILVSEKPDPAKPVSADARVDYTKYQKPDEVFSEHFLDSHKWRVLQLSIDHNSPKYPWVKQVTDLLNQLKVQNPKADLSTVEHLPCTIENGNSAALGEFQQDNNFKWRVVERKKTQATVVSYYE